ncbi:GNAT family N-acetyltransferase [Myroides sp. LJL115]
MSAIRILPAYGHLQQIKELFTQYTNSLQIDLDFQNYSQEFDNLPGEYQNPNGALYIAFLQDVPVGCIALRPLNQNDCEMKRLFVKPNYRGYKIGKLLCLELIEFAKNKGYDHMYLDTLDILDAAVQLYLSLGFKPTKPYYPTPLENTLFFKYDLKQGGNAIR